MHINLIKSSGANFVGKISIGNYSIRMEHIQQFQNGSLAVRVFDGESQMHLMIFLVYQIQRIGRNLMEHPPTKHPAKFL